MSHNEPIHKKDLDISVIVNQDEYNTELQKYYSGHNENSKKLEWTNQRIQNVIELLDEYCTIKSKGKRATNKHYHHARKYDVMTIDNKKALIVKRKDISDPVVQIIPTEEYYQKILDAHIATGHGRRDKIVNALKDKYVVPIFAVLIFLKLCKTCLSKKSLPKKRYVVKPSITDIFNRRGQIHLIDFQKFPDQEYKWLLHYQDQFTKFCFLRPLKSNQAKEVAIEILKIFLEVGCPHILQSDYGREFTASVLKEIVSLWPACKMANGKPKYTQSQGNLNQDIKNMIRAWMTDNKSTNWSIGCYFVQFQKNSSSPSTIARTPYKALFGEDPKLGLSSSQLPKNKISKLENEEDLEKLFEEINNTKEQTSDEEEEDEQETLNTINVSKIETTEQEETTLGFEIIKLEQINIADNTELLPALHENLPALTDIKQEEMTYDYKFENQGELDENSDKEITLENPYIGDTSVINEEMSYLVCSICNKASSGAHTCTECKKIVHTLCGVVSEENGSQNLKRAADKMISTSSKKFKDIHIGSTVFGEAPKADEGPLDTNNLIKLFINMFVDAQKDLNALKEERRKMYKQAASEIMTDIMKIIDAKFADLDRRSQSMDDEFMKSIRERSHELIRQDCKQKQLMVTLLREDTQAVLEYMNKGERNAIP